MTADKNPRTSEAGSMPAAAATTAEGIPAEWMVWASAIERQEDLRFRVARRRPRARLAEAFAQNPDDDMAEEAHEFTAQLRAGADRPELHPQPRRWGIARRTNLSGS